jgi:two-component system cell cycle response regulator DivK
LTHRGTPARPSVLIVEDVADTREMYAWCMRAAGWLVETVVNGREAVLTAAVLLPDVIVMDLALPVLDGFEATRRLKVDPETRHIPIVAVSAQDREEAEARAKAAGCDLFLAKPCLPEDLRAILEQVVAGGMGTND